MTDSDVTTTAPAPVAAHRVGVYERPSRFGSPYAIAIGVVAMIALAITLFMLLRRS